MEGPDPPRIIEEDQERILPQSEVYLWYTVLYIDHIKFCKSRVFKSQFISHQLSSLITNIILKNLFKYSENMIITIHKCYLSLYT